MKTNSAEPVGSTRSLADRLIDGIQVLTSNRDLINTRLSVLTGEGLKTASIIEISNMYRTLVSQVAVLYETEEFQKHVAPFIEQRFRELGSPSLIPGTIGSYIFGCYLSDYGVDSLSRFCTPVCAASIRLPNPSRKSMRCTEKVIWTDGGETPVFIMIEDDPANSNQGKVFIPWIGDSSSFVGLTQGAIDEIRSMEVDIIEVYGQLFNNRYIELLSKRPVSDVKVVERIRIKPIEYVASKNGGTNLDVIKAGETEQLPSPKPAVENSQSLDKKSTLEPKEVESSIYILVGGAIAIAVVLYLIMRRK